MTAKAFREELSRSRDLREAAGALAIVPTSAEVPGGGPFTRVDDLSFVVAGDDPAVVSLVYLVLRELVALVAVRQGDRDDIDLAKAEAQINLALSGLTEFDDVARLTADAQKTLVKLFDVAGRARKKVHQALTDSLATLHG